MNFFWRTIVLLWNCGLVRQVIGDSAGHVQVSINLLVRVFVPSFLELVGTIVLWSWKGLKECFMEKQRLDLFGVIFGAARVWEDRIKRAREVLPSCPKVLGAYLSYFPT